MRSMGTVAGVVRMDTCRLQSPTAAQLMNRNNNYLAQLDTHLLLLSSTDKPVMLLYNT
jgi:hypothetical protein